MANIPNLSDYTNELAVKAGQFGAEDPVKVEEAESKRSALENVMI